VPLWLPSRRLTRSLVAIVVGGRISFYGCHNAKRFRDFTQQL
jgi:hypothetical protein